MNTYFTLLSSSGRRPGLLSATLWAIVLWALIFNLSRGNQAGTLSIDGNSAVTDSDDIQILDDGVVLLPIRPIAAHYGGKLTITERTDTLIYIRPQDGAEFRLRMSDGLVMVNGKAVGYTSHADRINRTAWRFPTNIIETLTGTHFKKSDTNRFTLTLDKRLQKVEGFSLMLDGRRLPDVNESAFAIGSTLILPLETIARALGHTISVDRLTKIIRVRRAQDQRRLSLNLSTGVVLVGERPVGIAPNLSFADIQTLMLPKNAVETLTGTHISLNVKERQIIIELDDRLDNTVAAGARIEEVADREPATLESIDYLVDTEADNTLSVNGRIRRFNLALRFETPTDELDDSSPPPSWISLDWRSISGLSGAFGDTLATQGELSGVDVSRIRGASLDHFRTHGSIRAFVGQPLDGSRRLSDTVTVPEYSSDIVAGIRYFPVHGDWDAGLSLRQSDTGGERVVAGFNGHRDWAEDSDRPINTSYSLDVGAFAQGPVSSDFRGGANLSFDLGEQHITARTHYEGIGFASFNPRDEDAVGFDTLELSTGISRTFGQHFGTGLQLGARRNGVREDRLLDVRTASISTFWKPMVDGPWLNFDLGRAHEEHVDTGPRKTTQAFIRSQYQRGRWNLESAIQYLRYDDLASNSALSLSLTPDRWQKHFDSGASFAIGPRFGALFDDRGVRGSLGLLASLDAGQLLGDRVSLSVDASYFDTDTQLRDVLADDFAETDDESQTLIYIRTGYRMFADLRIEASYTTDFTGKGRYGIALRGAHDINAVRRYREARKDRGVLTGHVFIDANGDTVRQPTESELAGVPVRVQGTQWQLRTNRNGDFCTPGPRTVSASPTTE